MNTVQIGGSFYYRLTNKKGKVIGELYERNLVVDVGRRSVLNLLAGLPTGTPITRIGVGTSPTPPTTADTVLTTPYIKLIGFTPSVVDPKAIFDYEFDDTEANGMAISEFGLYTDNGDLFARKVISQPIIKNSSFSIQGSWSIQVINL